MKLSTNLAAFPNLNNFVSLKISEFPKNGQCVMHKLVAAHLLVRLWGSGRVRRLSIAFRWQHGERLGCQILEIVVLEVLSIWWPSHCAVVLRRPHHSDAPLHFARLTKSNLEKGPEGKRIRNLMVLYDSREICMYMQAKRWALSTKFR